MKTIRAYKKLGIIIPRYEQLDTLGNIDSLWINPEEIRIKIIFKDSSWIEYKFKPGFIFDKASNPVGKNNILESMPGVLCHDLNFSLHCLFPRKNNKGFRETNKLFYKMCRYYGMNFFRAAGYYLAVNSIVGRAYYENNNRFWWHKKTGEFTASNLTEWR
jgi:hypothetical protein